MSVPTTTPVITALTPIKRSPDRVSVKVGRHVVARLSIKTVHDLGLKVGTLWDDKLAARVHEAQTYDKAMRDAMSCLNRRAMSRRQLTQKLKDRDHSAGAIDPVLDRLTQIDLIDDRAFGRALIAELQRSRAAGPKLLKAKLFQKGLDSVLIDQLVEDAASSTDQTQQAMKLARSKLKTLMRLDVPTRRRRLWSALARRGYESDTITEVMEQLPKLDEDASCDI